MSVPGLRRGETPAREALEREAERQERRQERRDEEELEKARIPAATPEGEIAPVAPVLEVIPPAATREAEPGMRVEGPIAPPAPTAAAEAEAAARHATMRAMLLERDGRPAEALAAYEEALAAASDSAFLLWQVARLRLEQGSPEAALPVAEEAARLSPRDADVLMTYAQALYAVGDATGADLVFERVLELSPRDDAALAAMAQQYYNQSDWAPAARWFEELLKRDPGKLPVRHALGMCRLRLREYDAAIDQFKLVLEKYPNRETYLALAEAMEGKGDVGDAQRIYSLMAHSQRDDVESRRRLARLLVKYGSPQDHRAAADWFEDVLRIVPNDEEGLRMLAYLHFTFKQYTKSEEYLAEVLRLHPSSAEAHRLAFQMGGAYLQLVKDASSALRVFQLLKQADPDSYLADKGMALAYLDMGRREEAKAAFQAAIQRNPDALDVHINLVELYRRDKNHEAVLPHLEAAARLVEPASAEPEKRKQLVFIHDFRAQTLLSLARYEEARAAAQEAAGLDPDDEDAAMLIAQTYLEEGRLEEMEAVARQYLARHPGNAHLLNFLGYAFADKNMRLEEAEQLIRRALEAAPDNGSIVDSLGWVLYRKGRVEEAIAELERAARLSPDSPEIIDHLGDAYLAAKRPEKAREQWLRALELDPSNNQVQEKLTNLKESPSQSENP